MTIQDFLRKLAGHWRAVAVCVTIGAVLALATLPVPKHFKHVKVPYRATDVLGISLKYTASTTAANHTTTTLPGGAEISHLAALGLKPVVAQKAAAILGGNADAKKLAKQVGYATDFHRNDLLVKAKDATAAKANKVAMAFSNALIATAVDEQVASQQSDEKTITAQLATLADNVSTVRAGAASSTTVATGKAAGASTTATPSTVKAKKAKKSKVTPAGVATPKQVKSGGVAGLSADAITQAKISALLSKYTTLYGQLQSVETRDPHIPPLEVLSVKKAVLDKSAVKGQPKNKSRKKWLAEGIAAGLLIGLLLALAMTLLDRSLATPAALEEAFGLPILADVPRLSERLRKRRAMVVVERPVSAGAEAYRRLRSAMERMPATVLPLAAEGAAEPNSASRDPETGSRRTDGTLQAVALVGAVGRVGTTTSVANLAAALAEARIRPLAVDTNLRRPALHRLLGGERVPGVADEVDGAPTADRPANVPGVRLLPAGSPVDNPSAYIRQAAAHLARWRSEADVVVMDVADLATVNDVADLGDEVDALIVVSGRRTTTRKQAVQARKVLGLLGTPVLGLVLVDVKRSWRDRLPNQPRARTAKSARSAVGPATLASGTPPAQEHAVPYLEPVPAAVGAHVGSSPTRDGEPTEPIDLGYEKSNGEVDRVPGGAAKSGAELGALA